MREAAEPPTTPTVDLPSMIDLGRQHHALWRMVNAHDERHLAAKDEPHENTAKIAMGAATEQAEALEALMLTRPISSLADATALAVIAHNVAEGIGGADGRSLRCAFARLTVLLSDQSGVPLTDLGCGGAARCIARDAISGEVAL